MVHVRPFGRHEIPVFRALLLRLTDFLSVFLPAIFPMFVPAWGATERILGCLAKGCLGKGSRVRYPLEPVWGLLGFFRAVWMASGWGLSRLAVQRWFWSLLVGNWATVGGGTWLLRRNRRGTHPLAVTLCLGRTLRVIPAQLPLCFGQRRQLIRGGGNQAEVDRACGRKILWHVVLGVAGHRTPHPLGVRFAAPAVNQPQNRCQRAPSLSRAPTGTDGSASRDMISVTRRDIATLARMIPHCRVRYPKLTSHTLQRKTAFVQAPRFRPLLCRVGAFCPVVGRPL